MSKPTAIFLLTGVSKRAKERGQAITDDDLAVLDELSEKGGVDAEVLFICESAASHGKKPTMAQIREERPRLLAEIAASGAAFIVAFGPMPVAALWNKGGIKYGDLRMRSHDLSDVSKPVIVTASLEEMALKPGLRNWAALDVLRGVAGETPVRLGDYVITRELSPRLQSYLAAGGKEVTVDLETYPGLSPYDPDARIRMVVVSHDTGWAQVVQCGPSSEIPEWLRDLLQDPSVLKVGSNIGFDVRWLRRFGYEVNNFADTGYAAHLLDETDPMKDLKTLSLRYHPSLGDYAAGHRALVEERGGAKKDGWARIQDEEMYQYAGGDGDAGITIWHALRDRIAAEGLERPWAAMCTYHPAIMRLEHAGACVSMSKVQELDDRYVEELARLRVEIRGTLGAGLNPNSPDQLATALQQYVPEVNLRKVLWKRGAEDNQYSTEAFVLRREAKKHPVITTILTYRRRQALHKFVKSIRKYVVRVGAQDFVFSRLRGDVTTTYRHSSASPNLQNLPRGTEEESGLGLNVKTAYVSRFEGGRIMEWDQSQLELRETAMIAGDEALLAAFRSGEDVHTTLAAMMNGIEPSAVTGPIRQAGKTTNFHVLYGGGAWGLSLRLGCTHKMAEDMIAQFDDTFSGFRRWEKEQHRLAVSRLWVESRYGFRRRFARPQSWASLEGRHIKRQAGNAPIQGGASIHTNLGIVRVLEEFKARGLRSVPFLTVHDSLLIDVAPGEEYTVAEAVQLGMEHPDTERFGVELTVPLVVDGKIGDSWGNMRKYE